MSDDARAAANAVARHSYGKLLAYLAADMRDVSAAEDALSEAFAAALADWPVHGCPDSPESWLMTVARRKGIDGVRRRRSGEAVSAQLQAIADMHAECTGTSEEEVFPDRRLALLFACAHPAIDVSIRAPLMLQTVLGLEAKTIACAFLVSPEAMSKRLGRAKQKIREAGIPFVIPERDAWNERLEAVLAAIYASYAEGWSEPDDADLTRRDLVEEALFLARLLAELLPQEPETLGLLAGMLYTEARRRARRNVEGEYVPFAEQDTRLWDAGMIDDAEDLLRRASAFGRIGRYQLEAALQSAHIERRRSGRSDWSPEVQLYDALYALTRSPVVALNRALAVAELNGPDAAVAIIRTLSEDKRLAEYQPYWAARAALFARAGDEREALHAYEMAIGLACDPAVRRFLQRKQEAILSQTPPSVA
ncbi:DNA-directed RNA polymerase sigma-70 factor [Dyella nitratireducens]|uniref:DNA-directed RNA polymerase sigma-70 factor n=1 Tax=Dyella nitratireducens TaxID=1849580 RepID=A0ABQ1GJX7_9GAMM|nr:DNA-directed RNA polymerase sigma-70 factor [Dyella nitratireducens]GLQ41275.1 DNA-directed RNA polymerase sigma-70 factor [Dyella nitratireducens]